MKRFLIGCALALLICTNVFADVELGISFEPAISQKNKGIIDNNYDVTTTKGSNFSSGLLLYATPFFATVPIANKFTFDIGVNAQIGISSWNLAMEENNDNIKLYDEGNAVFFVFATGPAFRFNINKNNSIFATLGLKVLHDFIVIDSNPYFNFDIGYRSWFVNKPKFHLGLMTGLNFAGGRQVVWYRSIGNQYFYTPGSPSSTTLKSSMVNFYIGLNFTIGKSGYDKKANKWDIDSITYPQANAYILDANTLNDDFEDKVIFSGAFDLQKTGFAVYAYDMSASKWILVGRTGIDLASSRLIIQNKEDMSLYRYFAIVPTDKDAEAMQYSFNVEWHDLYVSVY